MKILLIFLLSFYTYSANASYGKYAFCKDREDPFFIQNSLNDLNSRLSFKNGGGLLQNGVCWWHNRFQRNSVYLVYFRPDLPEPSKKEAKKIIKKIRQGKSVVMIPGHKDMYSFSLAFRELIQERLEKWMFKDGLILQHWMRGLAGRISVKPDVLKTKMDQLYQQVSQGDVVYQKLQIKGYDAHSWLVYAMIKWDNGYELIVVDSNFPTVSLKFIYEYGMKHFNYFNDKSIFVPYTENNEELKRIKLVLKKFCKY